MRNLCVTVIAMALALAAGPAQAGFVVELEDPNMGLLYRIEDQGPNDLANVVGAINFIVDDRPDGLLINFTAVSKPIIPTPLEDVFLNHLVINVNFFRYPGDLVISVTDTDYSFPPSLALVRGEGSLVGGSLIEYEWFGDTNNQEFGRSFDIASQDFVIPGQVAWEGEVSTEAFGSLTLRMTLTEGTGNNQPQGDLIQTIYILGDDPGGGNQIFFDDFESGNTSNWSDTQP